MLVSGEKANDLSQARKMLEASIKDGSALNKFKQFISNQGGDPSVADNTALLPQANVVRTLRSPCPQLISGIDGEKVGAAALTVKAGRLVKTDQIDHSCGFILLAKAGDRVEKGQPIAEIYAPDEFTVLQAEEQLLSAYRFGGEYEDKPMLLAYVDEEGIHLDKNDH